MAVATGPRYEALGLLGQTDAEGLAILDRVLAERPARVVMPVVVDPARWQPARLMVRLVEKAAQPTAAKPSPAPASTAQASTAAQGLRERVQAWVAHEVAQQLRLDVAKLDATRPLQDYGVESVMLMQLIKLIGQRVRDDALDPTILYEHSTVASLSHGLTEKYGAVLEDELPSLDAAQPAEPAAAPAMSQPAPAIVPSIGARASSRDAGADIAVVGMSARFAGSPDLAGYWRLLREGRSAIRRVPPQRWGHASDDVAAVFDRPVEVDPKQFLLSPADARAMDPQALLVLDMTRQLWAHAGYRPDEVKGRPIGVYLGGRSQHFPGSAELAGATNPVMAIGQNYLAANVSRVYDLHGPSLVVDTACSSALVAMNLAVQALNAGEISAAVVGGVSLLQNDVALRLFAQRGILNTQPQFHLFDARASGSIIGEGAGLVFLKRLEQAIEDGDRIYSVIKGLAINNDGRSLGAAAPNPQAQKDVMQSALAKSGRLAHEIGYIEVSGSGTLMTDLLELKSIEAVYRAQAGGAPCQLGSIKPNIGHPLCAEGIAGFIKLALMLHHREWVPFLSGQEPMPHYDLAASPFRFTRQAGAWPGAARTGALNCFADGGTNAHVVLQEWETQMSSPRRDPLVLASPAAPTRRQAAGPHDLWSDEDPAADPTAFRDERDVAATQG
ncbi:MAG: beta-ketoacyl synthase N-terminal-like domain-containing protein, partial [Rhizobacter sp.]